MKSTYFGFSNKKQQLLLTTQFSTGKRAFILFSEIIMKYFKLIFNEFNNHKTISQ